MPGDIPTITTIDMDKKAMKEEREALEEQIAVVASIVRVGKEERPIGVERSA